MILVDKEVKMYKNTLIFLAIQDGGKGLAYSCMITY